MILKTLQNLSNLVSNPFSHTFLAFPITKYLYSSAFPVVSQVTLFAVERSITIYFSIFSSIDTLYLTALVLADCFFCSD